MQIARYLEAWDKPQCAGGARLAYAQAPLTAEETRSVLNEEQLSATFALTDPIVAVLEPRRILRVDYPDNTFDEWVIDELVEVAGQDGAMKLQLRGLDPLTILGAVGLVSRTESNGQVVYEFDTPELTPTEILNTYLLPALAAAGVTWVAAGTIGTSVPVTLTLSWDTPLAALRRLAEVAGCELRLRRNGTTNYLIDLVLQVGSGATTLDLRTGKNLLHASRTRAGAEVVTRVFGKGAALDDGIYSTLEHNRWTCGAPSGSNVVLSDPNGGPGPIAFDDQLNGLYVDLLDGTTPIQITDAIASSQTVVLASVVGISAGTKIRIAADSTGAPVTFLDDPVGIQDPPAAGGYGTKVKVLSRDDLPAVVNEGANPAMRAYAGASSPPDGYLTLGAPTLSRINTPALWLSGGFSCRIQGTADGDGIETPYATLRPTADRPFFSAYWIYQVATGQVRVELIAAAAALSVTSITRTGTVATVTTGAAHGLAPGQLVEITAASPAGYNGLKVVTSCPTTTTFTYEVAGAPSTPATGTITWARVWRLPDFGTKQAVSEGQETWDSLGVAGQDLHSLGASRAKLRIVQHGATNVDVYADAYQISQTAGFEVFMEGSGATRLWQACNAELTGPGVRWTGGILDVQGIDPTIWAYETIAIGQAVRVTHEALNRQETLRLLGWRRDLLVQGKLTPTLGTDFPSFTRQLMPARIPKRRPRDGAVDVALKAYVRTDPVTDTPGVLRAILSANLAGAALHYWIGDVYETPPNEGLYQAGAPASDKYGTYTAPFTINQDQTKDLQLAVFARVGTRRSEVVSLLIDRNGLPQITSLTQVEVSSPGVQARADWAVDDDVRRVALYRDAGAGAVWPVETVAISITRSGAVATAVTVNAHHLKTGDKVSVTGATQSEYNVTDAVVTVTDATHFTYAVAGTPATPATGAPAFRSCRNPLLNTKKVGEWSPTRDGGGILVTGALADGTTSNNSGNLSASDKSYVVAVPIDYRDTPGRPEDRGGSVITIAGAPSPQILTMGAVRTDDGSACDTTSGAQYTFTWTSSGLSDGTHKVRIIADVSSVTDTTPVASASNSVRVPYYRTSGKFDPTITINLSWELLDGSDAVIQSGTLDSDAFISSCAL